MNREELKEKELNFLTKEYEKNPQLFQRETFIDNPNFLEKFGIFIKGKGNFPLGYIKFWPQDFIVEEIGKDEKTQTIEIDNFFEKNRIFSEKDLTIYATLVKCGLSTIEAIEEISSLSGIDRSKIQFAGIKDKDAVTSQLISFRKTKIEELQKINSPHFFLKNAYSGKGAVEVGGLKGNEFTILIRTEKSFQKEKFLENLDEIKNDGFCNFFYLQRFGTPRLINFYWGLLILKGEYEGAVLSAICSPGEREFPYFKNLREGIKNYWPNFSKISEILEPYPLIFKEEIKMIDYLKLHPRDFSGALNQIPEQIKLWLYAFASFLFNRKLSLYTKKEINPPETMPLIFSRDENDWLFYKEFLKENEIFSIPFQNLKPFPYIQWQKREIKTKEKAKILDYKIVLEGVILDFILPKAGYATTFLAQLFNLVSGAPIKDISTFSIDTKATLGKSSLEEILNKFSEVIHPKTENIFEKSS
jgi:tRNA pseudouridine13 synthase